MRIARTQLHCLFDLRVQIYRLDEVMMDREFCAVPPNSTRRGHAN